jgi:hypothetical protein
VGELGIALANSRFITSVCPIRNYYTFDNPADEIVIDEAGVFINYNQDYKNK